MSWDAGAGGTWGHENDEGNRSDVTTDAKKSSATSNRLLLADLSISNSEKSKDIPSFDTPNEIVTIIVGIEPAKETFQLHREHARRYSPILAAAFKSKFVEGQSHTYELEEQHPGAFRHLMQWIYRQKFNHLITAQEVQSAKTPEEETHLANQFDIQTTDLLYLWTMADYLQIPQVQNLVIDALILIGPLSFPLLVSLSSDLYKRTAPGSRLRQFMAHTCAWNLESADLDDVRKDVDKDFLVDLIRTFRNEAPIHTVNSKRAKIVAKRYYVTV